MRALAIRNADLGGLCDVRTAERAREARSCAGGADRRASGGRAVAVFRLYRRVREGQADAMDVNALRTWGIAVGAVLMTAALGIAAMGPETPQARAETPAAAQGLFEVAQVQAAPVSFLVRFRGTGPIARAQAAAARGNQAAAERTIEAQLARQSSFAGLCFDRFTAGAAEVVLRSCDPVSASERATVQQRWLTRLRAMRAVAYADVNTTATQDRAPG